MHTGPQMLQWNSLYTPFNENVTLDKLIRLEK